MYNAFGLAYGTLDNIYWYDNFLVENCVVMKPTYVGAREPAATRLTLF